MLRCVALRISKKDWEVSFGRGGEVFLLFIA